MRRYHLHSPHVFDNIKYSRINYKDISLKELSQIAKKNPTTKIRFLSADGVSVVKVMAKNIVLVK